MRDDSPPWRWSVFSGGREAATRLYSGNEGPRKIAGKHAVHVQGFTESAISSFGRRLPGSVRTNWRGVTQIKNYLGTANGHHRHQAKTVVHNSATGNTNPEQMLLPREPCTESQGSNVSDNHVSAMLSAMFAFLRSV